MHRNGYIPHGSSNRRAGVNVERRKLCVDLGSYANINAATNAAIKRYAHTYAGSRFQVAGQISGNVGLRSYCKPHIDATFDVAGNAAASGFEVNGLPAASQNPSRG